jgi:hypothetical protein
LINYKAIDASTDMVITTSGIGRIYYDRIISSTLSPYIVDISSKTFKDPAYYGIIKALFIVDLNNARTLIQDENNSNCYLTKIDFSARSISY